jgi:hypothetical protein
MALYRLIQPLPLSVFFTAVILLTPWPSLTRVAMGQPGYVPGAPTCNSKTVCWKNSTICWGGDGNCFYDTGPGGPYTCPPGTKGAGTTYTLTKRTATYPYGYCYGSQTGALCTSGTVYCAAFNMYALPLDCAANQNIQCSGTVKLFEACYDPGGPGGW